MSNGEIAAAEDKMKKAIAAVRQDFSVIRTGRASPQLLDRIEVDYYGTKTPLNQLAGIAVPEARLLVITPYDKNAMSAIEKAISASDLGLNPSNDGVVMRLTFPQLTEERRKEMTKVVREKAEEGRIAVRNIRRHAMHEMQQLEKDGQLSQDELRRLEKELQKSTDTAISEIDELTEHKEKDLLEV